MLVMGVKQRTHKTEVEAIRKLVTALGGRCNVLCQGRRLYGSAGIPDLYCQLPREGMSFWVEVKVGRDRLSDPQAAFARAETDSGGRVLVGGLEDVAAYLGVKV